MERSRHLAGTVLLSSLHVLTNSSFTNLAIRSIIFMRHIYKNVLSAPFSLLSSYLFCFMGWPTLLSPFLFPSFFLFFYSRNSLYFCFSLNFFHFFIYLFIYLFMYLSFLFLHLYSFFLLLYLFIYLFIHLFIDVF